VDPARRDLHPFSPEALRAWRAASGLSRTQLAAAIGRSFHTVAHYERGLARPSPEALCRMAEAFGCTPVDIFGPPPPPEERGDFPPAVGS
jgi:transcriptional regulator with XRE-family HTH domain